MKILKAASILLLATLASKSVFAQEPPTDAEVAECDSKETCEDCLNVGFCDYYHGLCSHNAFQIADVARYTIDDGASVAEVCARAANDKADDDLCTSQIDCGGCTSAVLSDGVSTCRWFGDFGWCNAGCGMMGCGETTCPEVAVFPEGPTPPGFPEGPTTPIIPEGPTPPITGVDVDEIVCLAKTDETSCVETVLFESDNSCAWEEESNSCSVLIKATAEGQASEISAAGRIGRRGGILFVLAVLSVILQ